MAVVLLSPLPAFEAPVSNITAVYCGIVLLVLLFDLLDRTVRKSGINLLLLVAVVLASLTSLKTTFAPMAGVFFWAILGFSSVGCPTSQNTGKGRLLHGAVLTLLLPWMLDSYRSSGTFFYPVFGKGFHGSRYGTYLLPTANLGLHNILAFLNGMANALGAFWP